VQSTASGVVTSASGFQLTGSGVVSSASGIPSAENGVPCASDFSTTPSAVVPFDCGFALDATSVDTLLQMLVARPALELLERHMSMPSTDFLFDERLLTAILPDVDRFC
ncbi:unnamed protein product, partial [Pylaiella littoralis]